MSLRVLVVDDDSGFRALCKRLLQRGAPLGFSVIEASDASSAVEAYLNNAIDCVLVDFQLPDMLGTDLVQLLRKQTKRSVPMILLSAEDRDKTPTGERSDEATRFLSKRAVGEGRLLQLIQDVVDEDALCRRPRHERASTTQSTDNAG